MSCNIWHETYQDPHSQLLHHTVSLTTVIKSGVALFLSSKVDPHGGCSHYFKVLWQL